MVACIGPCLSKSGAVDPSKCVLRASLQSPRLPFKHALRPSQQRRSVRVANAMPAQNYPGWLVHWGHPGNMAVVLTAMGGYGAAYLGWAIRTSDNKDLVAKAKDLHPKLAAGMFLFFSLGAVGGMMSLLMQGKPMLESPHAITGLTGLGLLSVQAMLPLFFSEGGARTAHAFLGTGILGLFAVHAVLGLQLGLSF